MSKETPLQMAERIVHAHTTISAEDYIHAAIDTALPIARRLVEAEVRIVELEGEKELGREGDIEMHKQLITFSDRITELANKLNEGADIVERYQIEAVDDADLERWADSAAALAKDPK